MFNKVLSGEQLIMIKYCIMKTKENLPREFT